MIFMTTKCLINHYIKMLMKWAFLEEKDQWNINAGKVFNERKKKRTIPEKSTSDAATVESSQLDKRKDASVLKPGKEIHLLTHEK